MIVACCWLLMGQVHPSTLKKNPWELEQTFSFATQLCDKMQHHPAACSILTPTRLPAARQASTARPYKNKKGKCAGKKNTQNHRVLQHDWTLLAHNPFKRPEWVTAEMCYQIRSKPTPSRESQRTVSWKTNHNGTLRIQDVTEVSAKLCKSAWDAVRQQSSISFNVRCFLWL